jgi:hypothetical protein
MSVTKDQVLEIAAELFGREAANAVVPLKHLSKFARRVLEVAAQNAAGLREPDWFHAECNDPDRSGFFRSESDAQTQVNDHGGSVTGLYEYPLLVSASMDTEARASLRHFLSAAMIFPTTWPKEPVTAEKKAHGDAIRARTLDAFDEWFSLQDGRAQQAPEPVELRNELQKIGGLVDCGECRTQGCPAGGCRNAK